MKPRAFGFFAICLAGGLGLFWLWQLPAKKNAVPGLPTAAEDRIPPGIVVAEAGSPVPLPPGASGSLPGDRMLEMYSDSSLTARDDLILIGRAISSFFIIHKGIGDRPFSANEEWSATLRGKRPGTEPWISEKSAALDAQQRLVDRWGTPLHFHALGHQQWEIRSAGPDKRLWTGDDLIEKISA